MNYFKYTLTGIILLALTTNASAMNLQIGGSDGFNMNTDETTTQSSGVSSANGGRQTTPARPASLEGSFFSWPLIKTFMDPDSTGTDRSNVETILKENAASVTEIKDSLLNKEISLDQAKEGIASLIDAAAEKISDYIDLQKQEKWATYILEVKKLAADKLTALDKTTGNRDAIKDNQEQGANNQQAFRDAFGYFSAYLASDLTTQEKAKVKELITGSQEKMNTLRKNYIENADSGAILDWTGSVTTLFNNFANDMAPYIDSTKTGTFKAFVAEKIKLICTNVPLKKQNKDLREENQQIRQDNKNQATTYKRKLLSAVLVAKLDAKLDKIADSSKEAFFVKVIARIDALVAKTDKASKKALLLELKAYIQSKLDALKTDAEGENIINEVIDWVSE